MHFEFNPSTQVLINSIITITSCMGYRAQDLRIKAIVGEFANEQQVVPNSRFNGKLRFEFAGHQSFAEMEVNAVVHEAGEVVTNSYFMNQLPGINEGVHWDCRFNQRDKMFVKSSDDEFKFDFTCADASAFSYDPKYCEPNIDLGPITNKLNSLSRTIAGFVNRKSGSDLSEVGCVKICGLVDADNAGRITFEATNNHDAIYGEEPVQNLSTPWQVLIPIALFGSWSALPLDAFPMKLGIDANHQVTLRCGPITVQHNTLSNLISRMEDVAMFAEMYRELQGEELVMDLDYVPMELTTRVQTATIYADGDPSLHISNTDEKSLNIEVRAITTDANVKIRNGIQIRKGGEIRISKGALSLVSRIQDLCADRPEMTKPETWLNVRANSSCIMVASPDKRWLAVASQTSI